MPDIDPLSANINQLQSALTDPPTVTGPVATIEVAADGTIRSIQLTDLGRRTAPDALAWQIAQLHARALTAVHESIAAAVDRIEKDPRLQARHEHTVDTLNQPLPEPGVSN